MMSFLIGYIDDRHAPNGDVCVMDSDGRELVTLKPDEYELGTDGGVTITHADAIARLARSALRFALLDLGDIEDDEPRRFDA